MGGLPLDSGVDTLRPSWAAHIGAFCGGAVAGIGLGTSSLLSVHGASEARASASAVYLSMLVLSVALPWWLAAAAADDDDFPSVGDEGDDDAAGSVEPWAGWFAPSNPGVALFISSALASSTSVRSSSAGARPRTHAPRRALPAPAALALVAAVGRDSGLARAAVAPS